MPSCMIPHSPPATTYAREPTYRICREPKQPDARLLIARWREHSAKKDITIGKDIPSRAFAKFLSHIMVVEPINNDSDGQVRLAGTALRSRYGTEATGKRLSEMYPPTILPQYLAYLRNARTSGAPLILETTLPQDAAPPVAFEKIILRALAPDQISMWNVVGMFPRNGREDYAVRDD